MIVELLTCLTIIICIVLIVSVNLFNITDIDFTYYFFETIVYSGLWKGSFTKYYEKGICTLRKSDGTLIKNEKLYDENINGLLVNPFCFAKSDTYCLNKPFQITIEPILFEVSRGR
ncbi:MAG: hypothetical protein N2Z58_07865 [Fervidobacterium sp.]|nr:hypothetical protein [Fervidobacterium sp.]